MLLRQTDIEKCVISATDGEIGPIKDLYFDDQVWTIRYLIVDTGSWLSEHTVLISPLSIETPDWPAHRLATTISRDQVKNSPAIDTNKPFSRRHEAQYCAHYGYPTYWGTGLWGNGILPLDDHPGSAPMRDDTAAQQPPTEKELKAKPAMQGDDEPHLRSCAAVIGYQIHASDGDVGHVEGLLIDDETWAIRYLVVKTGNWWPGHNVLIAPQWLSGVHWLEQTVTIDLNRAALKGAPVYDVAGDFDRQDETELHTHYDRTPYWKATDTLKR